jgi:hypothetical protein
LSSKTLNDKHPERQRAYYQVYQALKDGTLTKLPCSRCQNPNSKATQTDYNHPLDVIWLCSLCNHRNPVPLKPYEPNPFEEHFRTFLNTTTEDTRWSSKWIKILKNYYRVLNLTEEILYRSLDPEEKIKGLGVSYKELITQFLNPQIEISNS